MKRCGGGGSGGGDGGRGGDSGKGGGGGSGGGGGGGEGLTGQPGLYAIETQLLSASHAAMHAPGDKCASSGTGSWPYASQQAGCSCVPC